jgi:multisubunit Na+/H+ antiporter MnhE subunit
MLHAAAMLCGLVVLWMLAAGRVTSPQDWMIAGVVALACVVVAVRFGGASRAFTRAPRLLALNVALVRVRSRTQSVAERAAFANMISATPGMAVVDADVDGLLVHVINEDAIDAADLGRLESMVGGGRQ